MKFVKEMIGYYTPLLASIKTMIGYNNSALVGVSVTTALSLEVLMDILSLNFLGVSLGFLFLTCFFILVDWWTGSVAADRRATKAKLEGDLKGYEEDRLKSSKVTYTIFKFMSLYLWLMLSYGVSKVAIDNGFMENDLGGPASFGLGTLLRIFSIVPVLLFCFREFVSIGENIKSIYGKVPYLFILAEKIFDILQFSFLSKIKTVTTAKANDVVEIDVEKGDTGNTPIKDNKEIDNLEK